MLHEEPKRDNFSHESPIRAFTTWSVEGVYAIGKGFRPSLHHTAAYLNALSEKEGWELVQILEATTASPSFVFRKKPAQFVRQYPFYLVGDTIGEEPEDAYRAMAEEVTSDKMELVQHATGKVVRTVGKAPELGMPYTPCKHDGKTHTSHTGDGIPVTLCMECGENFEIDGRPIIRDDPVNPRHYGGTACAEIGERLSANSYQVLKYNWRLGKKDDACQEIDKSLWYLNREIDLAVSEGERLLVLPPDEWFDERVKGQTSYVMMIVRKLVAWNRNGDVSALIALRGLISTHKTTFQCPDGRGLEA